MGDEGSENRKRAKDIYWGRFHHVQFSQFLPHGFDQQLAIPKKFSDNLRKKLPHSVTLKGPGGSSWTVRVAAMDDSMFFKQGWQEFVNDHLLAENDLLIFKYNNESAFKVLIFDGKSLCEKEYSYLVKKAEKSKQEPKSSFIKGKSESKRSEIGDEINNAASSTPFWFKKRSRGSPSFTRTDLTPSDLQLLLSPSASHNATATTSRITGDSGSAERARKGYGLFYSSNRRPVTEDEKAKTLLLAQAANQESSSEGFLVVLKPSHVYTRFFMGISTKWVSKFINLENQDLFMRFGEKEWRTRFIYSQARGTAGISSGWKCFSVDNNLEESDVVLFELGYPARNSLCFDVKIFRVVPEIAPLTLLTKSK